MTLLFRIYFYYACSVSIGVGRIFPEGIVDFSNGGPTVAKFNSTNLKLGEKRFST